MSSRLQMHSPVEDKEALVGMLAEMVMDTSRVVALVVPATG